MLFFLGGTAGPGASGAGAGLFLAELIVTLLRGLGAVIGTERDESETSTEAECTNELEMIGAGTALGEALGSGVRGELVPLNVAEE